MSTRLHISPLTAASLATLVPPSVQPLITDTSFHSIETFPEKNYGFVTLPAVEARKLQHKLNGAFLKGAKLSVAEARPDMGKRRLDGDLSESVQVESTQDDARKARKEKRRRKDGELEGVELPEGRSVKRGWVDRESGRVTKSRSSASLENKKMVFRSQVPANKSSTAKESKKKKKSSEKVKHSKTPVEVQEFEETVKHPTFLRNEPRKSVKRAAEEFVDGNGWVDADGNTLEQVATKKKKASGSKKSLKSKPSAEESIFEAEEKDDDTAEESTSGTDSEDLDLDMVSGEDDQQKLNHLNELESTPKPSAVASTEHTEVHPFEALFKRPAPGSAKSNRTPKQQIRPTPIKTAFSFFGDDEDHEAEKSDAAAAGGLVPPQTPFTRMDMEFRGIRSAAPTPDTAAIGKRFKAPWADRSESPRVEEEDRGSASRDHFLVSEGKPRVPSGSEEQTDFEKQFWANRGDFNRSWKARKREARKETRQKENRSVPDAKRR